MKLTRKFWLENIGIIQLQINGTHNVSLNVAKQELALIFNEIFGNDKHSVGIMGLNISVNFNVISVEWFHACVLSTVSIYSLKTEMVSSVWLCVLNELF